MSQTKNMWRIAHMSGVAKSTREWCICVAAIVIVITVGIWNCCALNDSNTVKMKPLEFPAIWHANVEITQFIWKIPCKCFHKKIC